MKRKIYFISILITVGGGAAVYFLSSIPFGLFFKLSAMTFFIGCLSTFLTLSISLLKSKLLWKKILCIPVIFLFLITGFVAGILVADNASGYTRLANTFLSIVPENSKAAFTKFPYSLTTEEWEKDIQYLKEELPKHHAYPFLYMQQEEFNNAIAQLESKLDKLSDKEISFEICRIVSMIKDGHTQVISIVFGMPAFLDTRLFPLRIFFFNDGVYVTDGGRDYKELEGLRITQIGSTKMEDIIKKINPYVPGENDYYKMQWAFPYLLNSGLLKYTGIIDDESARFIFKDASGKEVKKTISPVLSMQYLHWFRETLSLDDISRKGNQKKNYWYEYDKNTRTVFLQVNQVNNQQGSPSIKDFATELNDFININ